MDMSTDPRRRSAHRGPRLFLLLLLLLGGSAHAAHVSVQLDGVEDELREAVLASLELAQYAGRDVSAAQANRLYARAESQVRDALEPLGYYAPTVSGELREQGADFVAVLHVAVGEPTRVADVSIALDGDADGQPPVRAALAAFTPRKGQRLDHARYEKGKAAIAAALFASGYLDARLATHRVEVERGSARATIALAWETGPRYRFGPTTFSGGQFGDGLLERYVPWQEGDFYSQDKLLALQQRLVDADYFAIVQVQPDVEHAAGSSVPISVTLAPAKRTIYTGGLFIGTDTGPGVRGGVERRWINGRGHKLKTEALVAQNLKTALAQYQIPLAGPDNHTIAFGATYRDENTDTSQSQTFNLAATDARLWHGWTRTLGLKFLTGDFTVANIPGRTTLLYPEVAFARKKADDPMFVRDGWALTVAARGAAGGLLADTTFVQASADAKWIRGIGRKGRFIARGAFGTTKVDDFDKLPPELRFFAGGDRSIRGYPFQTIGTPLPADLVPVALARCAVRPRSSCQDLVVGGRHLLVASAEYEYYFKPKWGIAAFVDTGDAFSTFNDYRQKIGVGLGARWRSPVGMVRVDLGVPVNDSNAPSSVELHIVIGPDL